MEVLASAVRSALLRWEARSATSTARTLRWAALATTEATRTIRWESMRMADGRTLRWASRPAGRRGAHLPGRPGREAVASRVVRWAIESGTTFIDLSVVIARARTSGARARCADRVPPHLHCAVHLVGGRRNGAAALRDGSPETRSTLDPAAAATCWTVEGPAPLALAVSEPVLDTEGAAEPVTMSRLSREYVYWRSPPPMT